MLRELITYPFVTKTVQGLQIWTTSNHNPSYSLIGVKQKGDNIEILSKDSFTELSEAILKIDKNKPLLINIDGKGVLYKILDKVDEAPLAGDVLPSASEEDFYIQTTRINSTTVLSTIARKDHIDSILNQLNSLELFPQVITLGPIVYVPYIHYIKEYPILLRGYLIDVSEGQISEISRITKTESSSQEIQFGDEWISPESFAAFNSILIGLSKQDVLIQDTIDSTQQTKQFQLRKFFQYMLYSVPVVIFFLLLINFLLFMSYTRRGDLITSQLTLGQDVIQEIDRLETEIKTKKEFLGKTPEYSRGIISYYCDRIASMVGRDISLTSIVVYPEISTNRKTSITSEFDRGNIIIKGQCKNSNSLSELIKSLKRFSWIAEIDIASYNMDFATSNSTFELNTRIKSR